MRFQYLFRIILVVLIVISIPVFSQSGDGIPIGTWRAHLAFNSLLSITQSDTEIFAASEMGVLVFNKTDRSITTYNKLNVLTSSGITDIAYDETGKQLVVVYDNGNVDLVGEKSSENFTALTDPNIVTGSKRINHALVSGTLAYLSTAYGIVLFDLTKKELKETWRDLGKNGTTIKINMTAILGDSIIAATDKGVIIGNLKDNLLDFSKWKRNDSGDFSGTISEVEAFNNKFYVAINSQGIYHREGQAFVKESFLSNSNFSSLQASASKLVIVADNKLWVLGTDNLPEQVSDSEIVNPVTAQQDAQGKLWIADAINGLISNLDGNYNHYLPNGPSITQAFRLKYSDGKMFALAGGFNNLGDRLNKPGVITFFENGIWKEKLTSLTDVTDIAITPEGTFTASFGKGLQLETGSTSTIFNKTNSTLDSPDGVSNEINIAAIENSDAGLYVIDYGAAKPLHLRQTDNTWFPYSVGGPSSRYAVDLEVDLSGNVWLVINPGFASGLAIYHPETNKTTTRTSATGNGALPDNSVYSIARDRDGFMWVGTGSGIGYFYDGSEDMVLPIFDNRFLLRDEKITALAIDGGNRKWVGTQNGVWLFNPTGETLIRNFTSQNSPLLSNIILDIEINGASGEVFFATDKGIISYRGDATASGDNFETVKIFPNPVTYEFAGAVGISGLYTDSVVKITDVNGRLVWQTQAQGGTATWNVRDYNGRRADTGVYLVFATSQDGRESVVGKIVVIY
jgi:ligand-binding sensor domain-containing protein